MITPDRDILQAFLITQITEIIAVLAIPKFKAWPRWLLAVIIINCFTHPLVILSLRFLNWPYLPVEIGVVIIEAYWYRKLFSLSWKKSLVISAAANLASISAGLLIRRYFP